ncbi:hypothetical protein HispidOSU_000338 [Sigmodon hispidus]
MLASAVPQMTASTGNTVAAPLLPPATRPARACALGLLTGYRARTPINPRAGVVGTSARRPHGSRRRRGEPGVRAQPRRNASVGPRGCLSGRVRGELAHDGGGRGRRGVPQNPRSSCPGLGSQRPGGCRIVASEARALSGSDPLTLAASLCAFSGGLQRPCIAVAGGQFEEGDSHARPSVILVDGYPDRKRSEIP